MRLCFALVFGLVLSAAAPLAQPWTAYPAFNDVRAVASSESAIWAATPAGVFSYEVDGGAFARFTTVDGLRGGTIGALAVDAGGRVWLGYEDGALDRIDPETGAIRTFLDIERADQYASRGINRIRPQDGALLIATDFGLVVFDTEREEVRQTAARLGPLPAATPVRDVVIGPDPDGDEAYWLATDGGLVRAPRDTDNLQAPAVWVQDPEFIGEAYALAVFSGTIWVGGRPTGGFGDVYQRRTDGSWARRAFADSEFSTLTASDDALFAVARGGAQTYVLRPGLPSQFYRTSTTAPRLQSITLGPNRQLWAGDSGFGLFPYPDYPDDGNGVIEVTAEAVRPEGPFANDIVALDVSPDGTLWTATGTVEFGSSNTSGVSWLVPGEGWRTVRADDPDTGLPEREQFAITARPEGGALVGSAGGGLAVVTETGDVFPFDETNSTLRPAIGTSSFVVASAFAKEGDRWWVGNEGSPFPLHAFPGTESATAADWTALPSPPGAPTSFPVDEIVIDAFGQKWIAMEDQGLLVWDTGADPLSPSDDRARRFSVGLNGQGLPNGTVNALAMDREGRIWVGTARGIAIVFSPGSAFAGDAALAEPQWARTADGTSYLLRDAIVRDLTFDPAGQLWVATTTGAYLLNAAGDNVRMQLDSDTTPLPTDDLLDITVDDASGDVYIATAAGLYGYAGDAQAPSASSDALRVSPNPFRPREDADLLISGLNAPASRIRVLTVDGRVVYEDDSVFGGSFRWDGRDARTGEPVPSGVYLIAADGTDGEPTIYGKLAVLH